MAQSDSGLTVRRLMDALSGFDPTLRVSVEGCDCRGTAGGVIADEDDDGSVVLIFRVDGETTRSFNVIGN